MAPIVPQWKQPSHPGVQKIVVDSSLDFLTKSYSRVTLPPYAIFAKMSWPPVTKAGGPDYSTVQYGKSDHLNLNSDLLYINHSCSPSLIFDTSAFLIYAGPQGIKAGQELTFFYPSTEWAMAQGFDCTCGEQSCLGYVQGAKHLSRKQLAGFWLNKHIWELMDERDDQTRSNPLNGNGALSDAVTA